MPHETAPHTIDLETLHPRLDGRRAIVTGGAGGLGFVTARALARWGATIVIAARDSARANEAKRRLVQDDGIPAHRIDVGRLDLLDFDSVARFGETAGSRPLDLLVLNAGISSVPFRTSRDGIESQFATNHLGHFALTGHLLPALSSGQDPRVVTVSSALYKGATLDLGSLRSADGYSPGRAYSRSKLANTVFAVELGRRLASAGSPVRSFVAHPGMARTPLHDTYPSAATRVITKLVAHVIGREPEAADVGVLAAATSPLADPALLWGPAGSETRLRAAGAPIAPKATDEGLGRALWAASEEMAGVRYLGGTRES